MTRWKDGAHSRLHNVAVGLGLAVAYALLCWAARKVSLDQFYLPAGVRVAALLLVPPRLWPYLFLGEYAYFAQMRIPLIGKYGLSWVVLASALPMIVVATLVRIHRTAMASSTDAWLVSLAMGSAVLVTLINLGLSHWLWVVPHINGFGIDATRAVLGHFIGILVVAPLALLWVRRKASPVHRERRMLASLSAIVAIVALALASKMAPVDTRSIHVTLYLLMVVPAVALTCLHGWRGAAVAVSLVNLAIGLTTHKPHALHFDASALMVQQLLALMSVALITLGYSISHHYHEYVRSYQRSRLAVTHAKASHLAGEMDLRERVIEMREMGERIDHTLGEIAYWLRENGHEQLSRDLLRISVATSRRFRDQTSLVYPSSMEHVGLYLSLQVSGIAAVWNQTRRVLDPRLIGDPCQLSIGVQLAAYRAMTEAVSLLISHESGKIRVHARCGRLNGNLGIVVVVKLENSRARISKAASELAIKRITGRALPYGGTVQCVGNRIRILMLDEEAALSAA